MKIAVIGGGSTYTPELLNGFLALASSLPLSELWLMDIDAERLQVVGGLAQRMAAAKAAPFRIVLTRERRAAIQGAAYVITQLRVGKMEARRRDEYLGQRYGLIGQETTGVGGMAKALRTIPVILEIAQEMQALAPGALLLNFTNPSGLITEMLSRYAPEVPAAGVCNSPTNAKMMLLRLLEERTGEKIAPQQAQLDSLGINHLVWHRGLRVAGQEVWPQVLEGYLAKLAAEAEPAWDPHLIEALGMIPSYYLEYYYYPRRSLAKQAQWPPSRAEAVMEIERGLLQQYADPGVCEPPAELMLRGGAYYSTAATHLIHAHYNDLGEVHIINTRQNGAVAGWPEDWVLEMPCRVNRAGLQPLPTPALPLVCSGLLAHVKSYEILTVEAAVRGNREAAYQALLAHPLGPEAAQLPMLLDEMLEINRRFLPQFWPDTRRDLA